MSGIVNSTGAVSGIIGTTVAPAVGTGTDGYVLTATGAGVDPAWEALVASVAGTGHFVGHNSADSWNTVSAGGLISMDAERHDPDGVYGSSLFTAPAAGTFIFTFSIYTANNDASNQFHFGVNGSGHTVSYHGGAFGSFTSDNDNDTVHSHTQIITLSSGNTVGVYATVDSDHYEGHSWWGGCRLR